MPNQTAIAFTVRQGTALMHWGAERPLGLCIRLTVDTDEVFEVSEIYHRDTKLALWMLFAVKGGVIVLSGGNSDEWKTDSVKAALEKLLEQATGDKVSKGNAVSDWADDAATRFQGPSGRSQTSQALEQLSG